MTPVEKAMRLLEKHWDATYKDGRVFSFEISIVRHKKLQSTGKKGYDSIIRAKECALITVDEIIKALPKSVQEQFSTGTGVSVNPHEYFQSVKEEIQKL